LAGKQLIVPLVSFLWKITVAVKHKMSMMKFRYDDVHVIFCDEISMVGSMKLVPERLKNNPGETGNLETELKLKIGAPVVVTSNHSKQKFREDGIVNGARGYVQSISVSKDNT
jgi:hypothetical protein